MALLLLPHATAHFRRQCARKLLQLPPFTAGIGIRGIGAFSTFGI